MAVLSDNFSSLSAASVSFKVTPEVLSAKAGEISGMIQELSGSFSTIQQRVNNSTGYWQGDAAAAYRSQYAAGIADADKMLADLNGYVTKLNTIAGNYTQAEQAVVEITGSLPADVIT